MPEPEPAREKVAPPVALIPGGVRGIGKEIALRLARNGWAIATCYRQNTAAATELQIQLEKLNAPAWITRADVADATVATALVRETEQRFGHIDALINCIGAYHRVALLEESIAGWHDMFDSNLHPVFYLCRAAAVGFMRRGRGRIINFSLVNAEQQTAQPFITAHYIAKAGVLVLTRSLAKALAPYGVTANAISPGFIDSGALSAEEIAQSCKSIPAGYLGRTEDEAALVLWLLSEDARYVNGANIQLSGAWGV